MAFLALARGRNSTQVYIYSVFKRPCGGKHNNARALPAGLASEPAVYGERKTAVA